MLPIILYDYAYFNALYPEFAVAPYNYNSTKIETFWDQAIQYISDVNFGVLRDKARKLAINQMTAHLAYINNLASSGEQSGIMTAATVGDVNISLTPPPFKDGFEYWIQSSIYGMQLLALLNLKSVGGIYIASQPAGPIQAFRNNSGGFGKGSGGIY